MPYGIRRGGADCAFEVYKKSGAGTEGSRVPGGCHPTNDAALGHQRALTLREQGVPRQSLDRDVEMDVALGLGLFDAEIAEAKAAVAGLGDAQAPEPAAEGVLVPGDGEHFHAVMHRQGKSTGRRTFTNLKWREPPFAYHWQKGSSAHGGTPLTLAVGLVSRVVPVGEDLHAFGPLDLESPDGLEYGRRLARRFERWVSIGLDEQPYQVTEEWADDGDGAGPPDEMRRMFGEQPDQTLIDGGTIGELTGTSIPAQADAEVEPTPALLAALAAVDGGLEGDAQLPPGPKPKPAVDGTCPEGWTLKGGMCMPPAEGENEEAAVDEHRGLVVEYVAAGPAPAVVVRGADVFGYQADDGYDYAAPVPNTEERKRGAKEGWAMDDGSFPIRDCSDVSKAVHAMNRPTNKSNEAIRRHIIKRAKALGCALPEAWQAAADGDEMADLVEAVTAAAHRISIPDLPPASWFDAPTDVEIPGAFCITDGGRIYGILAPLHTGHRAFAAAGRRLTVPHGNVDLSRWMGGEALTREGRLAGVGPITMDCGHASRFRSGHDVAPAHYENSCAVFAKARAGETPEGLTWVAGAVEPGITPAQLSRALVCRLSGDWQPHPDRPGWDELVAALLVPAPAFAGVRTGPTVTQQASWEEAGEPRTALVASSVPVRFVGAGTPATDDERRATFEAMAARGGSDPWAVVARRINRRAAEVG
jgi:hypothetical protein